MITLRALGLDSGFVSTLKWATVKKLEEVEMGNLFRWVAGNNGNFISVGFVTREADLGRGKIAQIPQ